MRDPDGNWYGFSSRARVIVYNKAVVKAADVPTYESLADPQNKGKVCTRSGSHPYNLSLVAALIAHNGEAKAEEWAKGVVANMARTPRGGDTDQIKGVAAGECAIALSNTYYYVRLLRSTKPEEKEMGGEDRRRLAGPGELRHARQHLGRRRAEECAASRERDQVPRIPRERSGAGVFRQRQQRMAGGQGRRREESRARIDRHVQGRPAADRDARQEHARGAEARSTAPAGSNAFAPGRATPSWCYRRAAGASAAICVGSGGGSCRPAAMPRRTARARISSGSTPTATIASDGKRGLGEALVVRERVGLASPACRS